jgi:hypothetical protein
MKENTIPQKVSEDGTKTLIPTRVTQKSKLPQQVTNMSHTRKEFRERNSGGETGTDVHS